MYQWFIYVGIFVLGMLVGYIVKNWLMSRHEIFSGAMVITEEDDKRLYSLELYEAVEDLDHRHEIRFKVIPPEKKSIRG